MIVDEPCITSLEHRPTIRCLLQDKMGQLGAVDQVLHSPR